MFQRFDRVRYTGSALEMKGKFGEVITRLATGGYVVDFNGDGYLVNESNLVKANHVEASAPETKTVRKWEKEVESND
jgi:hypothetical protein